MRRSIRLTSVLIAAVVLALVAAACGQEQIAIPKSDANYQADYSAARVFHERCGGCHTLSYAAANGSGANPRTYLAISGPNFNVRCERPVERVLYAIENGGFGGAYMPANIVVGKQARAVAEFVSKFAGRQAVAQPDTTKCVNQKMGTLPPLPNSNSAAEAVGTATTPAVATHTVTNPKKLAKPGANASSQSNPSPGGGQ
jgi:mono/diheme cytochrome c family protein